MKRNGESSPFFQRLINLIVSISHYNCVLPVRKQEILLGVLEGSGAFRNP